MPPQKDAKLKISGDIRFNKVLDSMPGALEYIVLLNLGDFSRLKNPVMRKYLSPRISLRRVAAITDRETSRVTRSPTNGPTGYVDAGAEEVGV